MLRGLCACLAVVVIAPTGSAADISDAQFSSISECRHDQRSSQEDRNRRGQAVVLAKAINAAEADSVRRTQKRVPTAGGSPQPADRAERVSADRAIVRRSDAPRAIVTVCGITSG